MNHTVEFWGDQKHSINFKPDYVDSKGSCNSTLGWVAIKQMGIKDWQLQTNGSLTYYYDQIKGEEGLPSVEILIAKAQRDVTDMMDALAFWKQFADTFKEYNHRNDK